MLVDDFLPVYDVSDAVATVVHADLVTTWDALMEVDLIDVGRKRPLIGLLGAIRILPAMVSQIFIPSCRSARRSTCASTTQQRCHRAMADGYC